MMKDANRYIRRTSEKAHDKTMNNYLVEKEIQEILYAYMVKK